MKYSIRAQGLVITQENEYKFIWTLTRVVSVFSELRDTDQKENIKQCQFVGQQVTG